MGGDAAIDGSSSDGGIWTVHNTWRTLATGLDEGTDLVQPAGGVIGGMLVIAGGRTDASAYAATNKVFTMNIPSLALPDPSFLDSGVTLTTARWGAAYAVVGQTLWIIGGSDETQTCLASVEKLTASGSTLTRADGPTLPITGGAAGLCQATAVAFSDGKIVVTGGTLDLGYVTGSDGEGLPANTATFILDTTGGGSWSQLGGATPTRFSQGGASNGTTALIVDGALFTRTSPPITNPNDLTATVQSLTSAGAYTAKVNFGQPTGDLLKFAPAAAFVSGHGYFVFGGSNQAETIGSGSTDLLSSTDGSGWTHITAVMGAPHGRYGHVLLVADPGDGSGIKLYAVAGATSTVNVTAVDEYFP
jgi:hypothetical protein